MADRSSGNNLKERIPELDAFRTIAIISVVLYHYYWRLSQMTTPGAVISRSTGEFFSFGYLGVPFFFVISGFVIAATLGTSQGFLVFWKKRAIRLLPAMVIRSLISLVFFRFVDPIPDFARNARITNFFYSLTFLHPDLLNVFLTPFGIHGLTLSGSYWSLWPEVQFYALASLLYFSSPERFYTRFISYAVLLSGTCFVLNFTWESGLAPFREDGILERLLYLFNLPRFLHWFLAGVIFHGLWSGRRDALTWTGLLFCSLIMTNDIQDLKSGLYIGGIMFLFMLLVFKRNALRLLNNRWIVFIGVASYGLYLIHENIGLWLIMHIGSYMGNAATILPLLVTVAMVSFSLALFKYFEKPVSRFLKNHWVAGKLQKSPLVSVEGAKSAD